MSLAMEEQVDSPQGLRANTAPADGWDRAGIAASAACIAHCLLTPLALVLLPAVGSWLASPLVHQFLAIAVVTAAVGSLAPAISRQRWTVLLPAAAGMSAVLFAAFGTVCCGPGAVHLAGLPLGSWLSLAGGLGLIVAHAIHLLGDRRRICC